MDVRRAGRGEVSLRCEAGTLEVVDAIDQLRDEEVEVGVALAMRVRAQVDGNAVQGGGEVGAVVEVEAAQEILVRLSRAAVLRDDQPWHQLQHLAGPEDGAVLDQLPVDPSLARRVGSADRILVVSFDVDVLHVAGIGRGLRARQPGHQRCEEQRAAARSGARRENGNHSWISDQGNCRCCGASAARRRSSRPLGDQVRERSAELRGKRQRRGVGHRGRRELRKPGRGVESEREVLERSGTVRRAGGTV